MSQELNTNIRMRLIDEASKALKKIEGGVGSLKKQIGLHKAELKEFALGAGAAGAAGLALGAKAIKAASDLQELNSKAQVLYKDALPQVTKEVEKVAQEVGRAQSQILGFSANMAAVLDPMGLSNTAMKDMSVSLAKLAVDMASFHNVADEEAFAALRSGIVGETEPLKRLGIVMTQTNLQAYALSQGIKTNTQDMSQAQLATLRYNYIMQATSSVQGDAARTGTSVANQLKRLQGNVQALFETLGEPALEMTSKALIALNGAVEKANQAFKSLSPFMQDFIVKGALAVSAALAATGAIVGLTLALGKAALAVKAFALVVGVSMPLLGALALAVGGVTAAYLALKSKQDTVIRAQQAVTKAVDDAFNSQMDSAGVYIDIMKQMTGSDAEYARLRAKAHTDSAAVTAAVMRLNSAMMAGASAEVGAAIEDEIKMLNLRAGDSARAAIAFGNAHAGSTDRVKKKYAEMTASVEDSSNDMTGAVGGAAKKAEEDLVDLEEAIQSVHDNYTTAIDGVEESIEQLEHAHKEKMKGMDDQIKQVGASITQLEKDYNKAINGITGDTGEAVVEQRNSIKELREELAALNKEREKEGKEKEPDTDAIGRIDAKIKEREEQIKREEAALAKFLAGGISPEVQAAIEEATRRDSITGFERTIEDLQLKQTEETAAYDKRKAELTDERAELEKTKTLTQETYLLQRTELEATRLAMTAWHNHYVTTLQSANKTTQIEVDAMNAKLKELQRIMSEIRATQAATARLQGGGTRGQNNAVQRVQDAVPFANGGVVHQETYARIAERTPEAVVPLVGGAKIPVQLRGNTGGATTININLGGVVIRNDADIDTLTSSLAREMQKIKLRSS